MVEKTEKQKMLAGELYLAFDPELAADNKRACRLLRRYNTTTEEEPQLRLQILQELFTQVGPKVQIVPPFTVTMAVIFLQVMGSI
jgi:maltose O-acetyltransferase